MKLKLKILLISVAVVVTLGCILTVAIEHAMFIDTQNKIEIARREAEEAAKKQQAVEDENKHQDEKRLAALNTYDQVEDYYHGLALVRKDNKYGYIDEYGNEVIKLQYDVANNFINSKYTKVKKDGKWGYINKKGEELIPIDYSYCGEVFEGIVAVGKGGKYGFISIDGKEISELKYDKVEPFDPTSKLAKVISNNKFGMINTDGVLLVPVENDYVDENFDFTGEWKETDVHSSKAGTVMISGQLATSFNFEISSKYFAKSGTITGTADIVKSNVAEYKYNSGDIADTITFTIIDGMLNITAKNEGCCDLDKELAVMGTYTLESPKYTNDKVIEKLFGNKEETFTRIKNVLGEDVYEEYFLYGFKNGEYTVYELDEASDVFKGNLYTVKVPTLEKDFKLLITKSNIYFYAVSKEIYKTDDEARSSLGKMPSAITFDEI